MSGCFVNEAKVMGKHWNRLRLFVLIVWRDFDKPPKGIPRAHKKYFPPAILGWKLAWTVAKIVHP